MDYIPGSVAALLSGGNTTPSRPKHLKRAHTPIKHQASPNVTPKSEYVDDRSVFLSPSVQKKKAIVKKSPKRIFGNSEADVTNNTEGVSTAVSPKTEKVKKHLKDELDADERPNANIRSSIKAAKQKISRSVGTESLEKFINISNPNTSDAVEVLNDVVSKKKKKKQKISGSDAKIDKENKTEENEKEIVKSKFKFQSRSTSIPQIELLSKVETSQPEPTIIVEKKKKRKKSHMIDTNMNETHQFAADQQKRNKKLINKNKKIENITKHSKKEDNATPLEPTKKKSSKCMVNYANPNAMTDKDTDSEHESDNDINSETEEANNQILDTGPLGDSSDEDDNVNKKQEELEVIEKDVEEESRRTLFVGNVLFTSKCKKEIKKIFSKYGQIETIRIRTVPVKDARITPKLAVIRNELHPDRTTVHVYVRFANEISVAEALTENNMVLNGHHLRVTRSVETGVHDAKRAVFVGNMPFAIEDETLRAKFEKCGDIESVRIVRDRKTNAGKGFGYVNFVSKDAVELALAMTEADLTIKNRILRVKRCTQLTNNQKAKASNKEGGSFHRWGTKEGNLQQRGGKNQVGFPTRPRSGFQGRREHFKGRQMEGHVKSDNYQGKNQSGDFRRNQGATVHGRYHGGNSQGGNFRGGNHGDNLQRGENGPDKPDGAYRRIMKRQNQESGDGAPLPKMPKDKPVREKKERKEFVGITAEKKKKSKPNLGLKKKKALSEILTK